MKRIFTVITIVLTLTTQKSISQTWINMENGLGSSSEAVKAIAVDPNGNIYAGGTFTGSVSYIAKWTGSSWVNLGSGLNGPVYSIGIKTASDIYVAGEFTLAGGTTVSNIARWNGTAWSDIDSGFNAKVTCVYASPSGTVYAGGAFSLSGTTAISHVAKLQSNQWVPMGAGIPAIVNVIAEHSGSVYAGCDVLTDPVQKWDGTAWSAVSGISGGKVLALASYSNELYAGGEFQTPIRTAAKWNGSAWVTISTTFNVGQKVSALFVKGSNLYIAGNFTGIGLGTPKPNYIARITGSGIPIKGFTVSSELTNGEVFAINYTGGKIMAGGTFVTPASPSTNNISITSTGVLVDEIGNPVLNKKLYPNPVHGQAQLSIATKLKLQNPQISIYDMQSRLVTDVKTETIINNNEVEFLIDCNRMAKGNYTYMISDDGQVLTTDKFIVE